MMSSGSRIFLLLLSVLAIWSFPAFASSEYDQMIIEQTVQRMQGADGGSLGMDWLSHSDSGILSLGAKSTKIGGSKWTLVGLGGTQELGKSWTLGANIDIGPASIEDTSFTLKKNRIELGYVISPNWTINIQEVYVNVNPVSGHILGVGSSFRIGGGFSIGTQVSGSYSGNLDDEYLSARIDYRKKIPYITAGIVIGSSNNHLLLNVPESEVEDTRLRQGFAGVSFPFRGTETSLILDTATIDRTTRYSFSVIVRLVGD